MGQLTNLYVSESYQGLIKLADSTTGVTTNLQYLQDGLGNNLPIQVSSTDVTISGSLSVTGQTTLSGLDYPTADGLPLQFLQTDGSGSLTFAEASVTAVSEIMRNGEATTITKGTPVYVSGSNGAVPIVFRADANDPDKMPAIYIANTNINSNQNGSGLLQGLINGVNTTGFPAGTEIFVAPGGGYTATRPTGSAIVQFLGTVTKEGNGGAGVILNPGAALLPNLASDNLWLGNVDGVPQQVDKDSLGFATTSSLTSLSSSIAVTDLAQNNRLTSLETNSGSQQLEINQKLNTSSFNSYTSSNDSRVSSLESKTGSYATTGSNVFQGTQTISGSINVTGELTALSASITYLKTIYQTSSIVFSSGSNILGDEASDTQTLWGKVAIPTGPVSVTGSVIATNFTGSLQGTASYATQALSASWAPDTTNTGSLVSNVTGGPISFEDQITVTKGDGSTTTVTINNVTNADSASYATNALSASYAPSNPLPSGVVSGSAQIVDLGFATTSSVDTLSGSIAVTDLAQDGRLNSLESVTSSYITSAQTSSMSVASASYATNALSASYAPGVSIDTGSFATTGSNVFKGNQTVEGNISLSGSFNSIVIPESNYIRLYGDADGSSTSAAIQFFSGSNANRWLNIQAVPTSPDGDVAISDFPTNDHFMFFKMSNHTIQFEAALAGTGSAPMETKTGFINNTFYNPTLSTNERGFINSGSMVVRGNLFSLSNNTNLNPDLYVTNSLFGQTNIIKGWGDNGTQGGAGLNQANYTGSLRITGSNNTVSLPQLRATAFSLSTDHQGYISGSDNILGANSSGIYMNTTSQLFPKTQGNFVGFNSNIGMTFTTSSLGNPIVGNNTLYAGNLTLSHSSGSVVASSNLLNGAGITSTQNFVTNVRPSISANIVGNSVTLNHISSSINYAGNINNSAVTINNHLSSSITNNSLSVNNNMILGGTAGTGLLVYVSGSQNTNVARNFTDNLIGGRGIIVSSSFVSSSNSNLMSTLIYGNGLTVSGSHTVGTNGGSVFLGRFNDTTSLHLAQDIVLAVGTGTAAGSRRTGFYITSGSLVGISGSMDVKGNSVMTGSLNVTNGITGSFSGDGSGITGVTATLPAGVVSGSSQISYTGITDVPSGIISGSSQISGLGFAITGSNTFVGSQIISGSLSGTVAALSITSNTASMDTNTNNFFTLTLPDADTHILPTNIKPGQTINVKVIGGTTSTVTFPTSVKQPSGSAYVPTVSGTDILTFVSFDGTDIYMANVKKLI